MTSYITMKQETNKPKVRRNKVTKELEAQIVGLWNIGTSRTEIANTLSLSVNTIRDVIKRLQKKGTITKRHEAMQLSPDDLQRLADEAKVPFSVVEFLLPLARKNLRSAPLRVVLGSYLALWKSQGGKCYYTGIPLSTEHSPQQAVLMETGGVGRVFVTRIASEFRGKASHRSFLRMVGLIARNALGYKP